MTTKNIALLAADVYGYMHGGSLYAYGIRPAVQAAYHLYYKTTNVTNIAYNVLANPLGSIAIQSPPIKQAIDGTCNFVEKGTRTITQKVSKRLLPRLASAYCAFRLTHALREQIPYQAACLLASTPIESKPDMKQGKLAHLFFFCFGVLPIIFQSINELIEENSEEEVATQEQPAKAIDPKPTPALSPAEIKSAQNLQKHREQKALNLLKKTGA